MADAPAKKNAKARPRGKRASGMAEADLRAFEPIPFPEIAPGTMFNVNFCRNPMCPNFGPAPDLESYGKRYKVERLPGYLADRRYRCLACNMTTRLLSNRSLRAAYVWFKRQSIPFAACPKPGCANEGVNVFEHSGCYESKGLEDAKCRACGRKLSLGEPKHLKQWKKQKKRLAKLYGDLTAPRKGVSELARDFQGVNGGGIMLHRKRPVGPVAAVQNCTTCSPLSVWSGAGDVWRGALRSGTTCGCRGGSEPS